MKISFGKACFSVLMNLANNQAGQSPFYGYTGRAAASLLHDMVGGKMLYETPDGSVGGGYIPDVASVRACNVYRLNGLNCRFWDPGKRTATIGDMQVYVPIDPAARGIRDDWPVVITKAPLVIDRTENVVTAADLVFLRHTSVLKYLRGEEIHFQTVVQSIKYVPRPGADPLQLYVTIRVEPGLMDKRKARLIVEGIFFGELMFQWMGQEPAVEQPFYNRLRLWRGRNGRFYRITGGIGRAELESCPADLQAIAPATVKVLSPRLYIHEESEGRFVAVSLHYTGLPEPTHVVLPLTVAEACAAMGGAFDSIYERCEAAALGLSGSEHAALVTQVGSASGLQTPSL